MVRLRLDQAATRLPFPRWALAVVLVWLGLVATAEILKPPGAVDFTLCSWRNLTGAPCPTCGTTRLVRAAAAGRPIEGLLQNPFMALAGVVGAAWMGLAVVFRRRLRIELPPRGRRVAWALLAAAFLANWSYLILFDSTLRDSTLFDSTLRDAAP